MRAGSRGGVQVPTGGDCANAHQPASACHGRDGRFGANPKPTVTVVLSMVLTPQRFHEHDEHLAFFTAHMEKKGAEAARACLRTIRGLEAIAAAGAGARG